MGQRTDEVNGRDRTDEIRREIERTEREMSRTIDEIQHRLSPHYMMERTKHSMREAGVNVSRSFMDRIRENPIPAAMVGVGMFLMMRDSGHGDGYDVEFIPDETGWDTTGSHYSAIGEYREIDLENAGNEGRIAEARDRVEGAMSSARHAAGEKLDDAAERARRLRGRARSSMSRARSGMTRARYQSRDLFQDSPLIAGLAAVAAGAILGALIPESEREQELMGDARDRLADRAREKARQGVSRAKDVAGAAASAAKEAAKDEATSPQRQEKTDIGENVGIGAPPARP